MLDDACSKYRLMLLSQQEHGIPYLARSCTLQRLELSVQTTLAEIPEAFVSQNPHPTPLDLGMHGHVVLHVQGATVSQSVEV